MTSFIPCRCPALPHDQALQVDQVIGPYGTQSQKNKKRCHIDVAIIYT